MTNQSQKEQGRKKRYFPCPLCHGLGHYNDAEWIDYQKVSDDTPCWYCEEKGMVEINGEIHWRRKLEKEGIKHMEEGKDYTTEEIRELGRKHYDQ